MRLFTSESVTPGHPDKVCDQISDTILDAYLNVDCDAHVAVEVFADATGITIGGEVSSTARYIDHEAIARDVLDRIGYTRDSGLDPRTVGIRDHVTTQSREIAVGVANSTEYRAGLDMDEDDAQGAGDQGLMFGYATDETPELMPYPSVVAHDLARTLAIARTRYPQIRPDGKTQVTVGYDDAGYPVAVDTIVVSTQHSPDLTQASLHTLIQDVVVDPALRRHRLPGPGTPRVIINPAGAWTFGGPKADTGLTGRKIIVDTYGGMARHGGGAFSGKDPSKVDRSAAYAMRWVAKNVVAAGLAHRCEVQVAYAIGKAHPVGLYVETFGTERVARDRIEAAITDVFDLRPAAIIRELDLLRPIYASTATFGHFGADGRPWEALNRVQALRAVIGTAEPAATFA